MGHWRKGEFPGVSFFFFFFRKLVLSAVVLGGHGSSWWCGRAHRAMGVDPWCLGFRLLMRTKQYAHIRADAGAVASVGGRLGEEQLWRFAIEARRRRSRSWGDRRVER